MNVNRGMAGWAIVTVVMVLVTLFFGVRYPLPEPPPLEQPAAAAPDRYVESLWVDKIFTSAGTSTLTGAAALNGGLTLDTTTFTVADTTGNTAISGTLTVTDTTALVGATTVTGAAALNGGLTLAGLATLTAATSVTVTDGVAFAISGAWQPISAAGAVTPTITIPAAGVFVCIMNTAAQNVLIQDAGNQVLTADAILNQYDVLCGYSDGTRFIEVSRANN